MASRKRRARSNFSYNDKANIYALDRATCAFSGKSLWFLDYGLSYYSSHDWLDHELPCARGGRAEYENGLCASYEYNSKKGDNARDTMYLFRRGRPTEAYFDYIGPLSDAMKRQLSRHFLPSDWYFNRMVAMLDEALGERYAPSKPGTVRLIRYSQTAAWNRLQDYQRLSVNDPTMESRGLILRPDDPGTKALLQFRTICTRREFDASARALFTCYAENHDLHCHFWEANTASERARLLEHAMQSPLCHPLTLETLRSHHGFMLEQERADAGE